MKRIFENTLFLEMRGYNFWEDSKEAILSDVGNYRVGSYNNSIIGKDGIAYIVEFEQCDRYTYRKTNKRTGAPLKKEVIELLESGKDINKIFVTKGEKHGSINKILAIAKERRIIVVEKDKKQMDEMAQEESYQGVIAIVPPFEYVEIEDILNVAKQKEEDSEIQRIIEQELSQEK